MNSSNTLRFALAQENLLVGDITGNTQKIIENSLAARDKLHADAIIFPELTLTGYPPEDLLLRPHMHQQLAEAIEQLKLEIQGIYAFIGYPELTEQGMFNACIVIHNGEIISRYRKQHLPNYLVFDEKRYFQAGNEACLVNIKGTQCAISLCEDIWEADTVAQARDGGADLILNINASPFHINKMVERMEVLQLRHQESELPVIYLNSVGGQDELIFDGGSMCIDNRQQVLHCCPEFSTALSYVDYDYDSRQLTPQQIHELQDHDSATYNALVAGVRDYINKNGFAGALLGLSGGIDSALTLAIAVDALGADRVEAVLMPSRYTADMSVDDAVEEAKLLGVKYHIIPIEKPVAAFSHELAEVFSDTTRDTTEENIQARCRGLLLMAISNKQGRMVLATGNKSEMAVGYATLYGDMAGGFAPLKDVCKTTVYRLSEWRNQQSLVIPQRVIDRPPSAELAPDQKDEDSLPPYDQLDPILERYIERDISPADIIAEGFAAEHVHRVVMLIDRNEYKRRQAAPGVRITRRAFGRDRRYPITNGYKEL